MTHARHNPDPRSKQCKEELAKIDTSALPTASLIIVFHEEARSTLLRTIVSCAGRAPAHLLKEVILVDDFSQRPHLLEPLEDELAKKYPIVQLIRYMRSCTSSLLLWSLSFSKKIWTTREVALHVLFGLFNLR